MAPPKYLYKYQAIDDHSLENLTNNQIWFSKPIHLNDPWDCAIIPPVRPSSDAEWELVFLHVRAHMSRYGAVMVANFDHEYAAYARPNASFRTTVTSFCEGVFVSRRDETLNEKGVACFSQEHDNLLMWSHYGYKHTGFCIEYDATFEPFTKAFAIDYCGGIPSVNVVDMFIDSETPARQMLGTKAACWSYEQEWRILNTTGDTLVKLVAGCISGIYFGLNADSRQKARIMSILSRTSVQFYDMVKSKTEFKLETRPVPMPR